MGDYYLRIGDVIANNGCEYVIERVTDCSARCQPLTKIRRKIVVNAGAKEYFVNAPAGESNRRIAATCERDSVIRRIDKAEMAKLFPGPRLAVPVKPTTIEATTETIKTENIIDMSKNTKSKGKAKTTTGGVRKGGSLGDVMGYAATAVLRALGVAGVSIPHARAIIKAQGIKIPDHSAGVQVSLGRTGARPPAPLTHAQIAELKKSASGPVESKPASKPAAKKAPKAKAKAIKAPTAKASAKPVAPSTPPNAKKTAKLPVPAKPEVAKQPELAVAAAEAAPVFPVSEPTPEAVIA